MKIITIQDTFEDVIRDLEECSAIHEKFWIGERTDDGPQELTYIEYGKDNFKRMSNNVYQYNDEYTLVTPNRLISIAEIEGKSSNSKITSIAMSLYLDFVLIGTDKGSIIVYNLKESKVVNEIKGAHYSDVTHLRLFPSNKVFISIGLDMITKIWAVDGVEPVRVISDQTDEITDVKLVGSKGRNFLTSSKDGSVNLFECGTGSVVYKFKRVGDDAANCFTIGSISDEGVRQSALEFETEGKCLYVGYASGVIQQFDLVNHSPTSMKFRTSSSVESIDIVDKYLISGHENGDINMWDLKSTKLIHTRNFGSVLKLRVLGFKKEKVSLLIYAGPECLFKLTFDEKIEYLVGLPEMFKVTDIDKRERMVVATDYCIANYVI